MTFENAGRGPLDYDPCTYGDSRLVFRGPERALTGDYIAFLGGTETYGKFIEEPFPELVEDELGLTCVNLGQINAGVDVYLNDLTVLTAAAGARLAVVQVMGANNLSNRFYSVHPRRNDRFLKASATMRSVFRDIDFTEFHFTRHLLGTLAARAPERFQLVIDEVQQAWLSRMGLLLQRVGQRAVLLWFADHAPPEKTDFTRSSRSDPFAVERWMIEKLRPQVADVVEVVASPAALAQGTGGMVFSDLEAPAAKGMLGPAAHDEAAQEVVRHLARLLAPGARI
ncbi:MAG: DUF6473 family protein [Paracoccaceae bacterium]